MENIINTEEKEKEENNINIGILMNNKNFIEDIFQYSTDLQEYIPELKEDSNVKIQNFFLFIKNSLNYKSLYYNLELLKNIFLKSKKIIEIIQENKNYYKEEDKEFGMIGIFIELYVNNFNFEIHEILIEFFNLIKENEELYKKEVYFIFQKIGKEYFWEENIIQNYTHFIQYIDLLIFFFTGKDYSDLNKRKEDKIEQTLYSNNIYFYGGMNIFLPLFEKILMHFNQHKIFEKLLILIKELLVNNLENIMIAYNDKFFKLFSVFILNIDKTYFQNDSFFNFLFEMNESFLKMDMDKKGEIKKYIEEFYDSIFFKYEIIIKMNCKMINKYFRYLNKYENLYRYMKFNICCKFLNEINIDDFKNSFFIFINLMIKKIVKGKKEDLNNIIYYLLKDKDNEKIHLVVLKSLKNELINIVKPDSNIDYEFMFNLTFLISSNIEIKFLVIEIFQLLYFKFYDKLKEIFIEKENPFNNIFYRIITNFFESKITVDHENKEYINDIFNTPVNCLIENDFKNLKKLVINIIIQYIFFSISYMEPYNFSLFIPDNFKFELYIKIISNNLEELNRINNINSHFLKEKNLKHLINVFLYSKIYINESTKIKNNDNMNKYLINITKFINNILEKYMIEDITSNLGFKEKIHQNFNNLGFKFLKMFINKMFFKNEFIEQNFLINIIDEFIGNIYYIFTTINNNEIQNLIDLTINEHYLNGFREYFMYLKIFIQDIMNSLKKNNLNLKLSEIQKIFINLGVEKTFTNFLLFNFLEFNNINEINIKLGKMFKMLNLTLMLIIQCFLSKKNINSKNINFYLIFLYIIIDLGEYILSQTNLFDGNNELKNLLKENLIVLCFCNIQIILYLSLKNDRKKVFESILEDIINIVIIYENKNIGYMNLIGDSQYTNLFYITLKKICSNFDKKIHISEFFKIFKDSKKRKKMILNDLKMDFNNNNDNFKSKWEKEYIFPYNYLSYKNNIKIQKKYIGIKKTLFSFNGIFSNKKLFYEEKSKFKYKNSYHFTENIANPILKPILDWNNYISNKKEFKNIFQNKVYNYINLSIFQNEKSDNFFSKLNYLDTFITIPCFLMKITYHIKGVIFIKNEEKISYFEFFGLKDKIFEKSFKSNLYFSSIELKENYPYYIKIKFKNFKFFFERNYYYLNNSIEIFTKNNKSYYFIFNTSTIKELFLNIIKKNIDNFIQPKIKYIFKNWEKGKISTFKFLNLVNIYGNRSFKDITQFPIFPWILNDYSISENSNNNQIRKLNLPIGQLNTERKEKFEKKYNCLIQELDDKYKKYKIEDFIKDVNIKLEKIPYYYNTTYSNIDSVSYYLIRIFPFYFINLNIQKNLLSESKKIFSNLEKCYFNSLNSKNNLREIIPQFFYFPEIFNNINELNLGYLKENNKINNVLLPKWCNNNPFIFISIYREILELIKDEIVDWVNLIFGIDSRGENAKNKKNLFAPYSYINIIENKIIKLNNKEKEIFFKLYETGLIPFQLFDYKLTLQKERKVTDKNDLIFTFRNLEKIDNIFLYENKLYFFSKNLEYFSFDLEDQKITKIKWNETLFSRIENIIFLVKENIVLFVVDRNIFKMKNKVCYPIVRENIPDKSEITVFYTDKNQKNLYLGTQKGSIIIFKMKEIKNKNNDYNPIYFMSHQKKINDIKVNNELNILIDCSDDGFINLYTLPQIKIFNSIYKENIVKYIFISSSPLFCFITYNNLKKFDCYNINCQCINTNYIYNDVTVKKKNDIFDIQYFTSVNEKYLVTNINEFYISNSIIIRDNNFIDYLLIQNQNSIEIRKFPFMILVQTITFQNPYDKLFFIEDLYDLKIIKINIEINEVYIQHLDKSQLCKSPLIILN